MEKKSDSSKFSTFSFYRQKKETELNRLASGQKKSNIFSYFTRSTESEIEADIESNGQATEHTTLMSSLKAGITKRALGVKDSISQTVDTGRNLKYFMIFLLIGSFLIFMSLMFLPVVVLSPHKFACLFTLGSLCILIGLGYYHGIATFISQCDRIRVIYLCSLLMTFYFSIIYKSYLLVLLSCVVQLFAMLFFL